MLINHVSARRAFAAGAVAVACSAAGASSAAGAQTAGFSFDQSFDGTAHVDAAPLSAFAFRPLRLEVVRGGAIVATASRTGFFVGTTLAQPLQAGDQARLFRDDGLLASATYDGQPAIAADACIGGSSFTATRSAAATIDDAGAFTPGASPYGPRTRAIFTKGNPFTVTLDTPIAAGQAAFVETTIETADVLITSSRSVSAGVCQSPPAPPTPLPAATPTPTDAQVAAALKTALAASRTSLRRLDLAALARRKSVTLPFTFSEAGTARLRLTAKIKRKTVTIGTGTRTLTGKGTGTITIKLTAGGRAALKRAKTLKLSLKGRFTPARAGARPQSSSTTVTLNRKKKS